MTRGMVAVRASTCAAKWHRVGERVHDVVAGGRPDHGVQGGAVHRRSGRDGVHLCFGGWRPGEKGKVSTNCREGIVIEAEIPSTATEGAGGRRLGAVGRRLETAGRRLGARVGKGSGKFHAANAHRPSGG